MTERVDVRGMIAFDAYGTCREWVTHDGKPMPRYWDDLGPGIREAWRAAADAVHMYDELMKGVE